MSSHDPELVVNANTVVEVDYVLNIDGKEIENSKDSGGFSFLVGYKQVITGFESALIGHKTGETIQTSIPPQFAYGVYNRALVKDVSMEDLNLDKPLEAGMTVTLTDSNGKDATGIVMAVSPKTVTVDFNHPLADKTLDFVITVLKIRPATAMEIEQRKVL
ncbi:MAG TPA: FKBP-type peptidyl-prolyl cis-trans isomerase [Longilinea sp.]|nr:FKBP-type peptidyl-prolyl cis-trans isomerase [Longilinea sp.]